MDNFTKYLVIGPLSIDNLNATHPDIIAGYPMPTAVAGFGYKLGLDIERIRPSLFKLIGSAVVVHSHSEMMGHSKNPVEVPGKEAAPIIDELRARAELSFVLAFEGLDDEGGSMSDLQEIGDLLEQQSPGWIFGGGKVFPVGLGKRRIVTAADAGTLESELRKLPAGFALFDRHDVLEDAASSGRDTLDALLDIVELTGVEEKPGDEKSIRWSRRQSGWVVPLTVGFQAIETPRVRTKSRINDGSTPHVYAETIYSVGEYKSLRTLLALQGDDALSGAFWRHCAHTNSGTYFVSASNN
jgi:CRISPR type I-F-associated protein Csy2